MLGDLCSSCKKSRALVSSLSKKGTTMPPVGSDGDVRDAPRSHCSHVLTKGGTTGGVLIDWDSFDNMSFR